MKNKILYIISGAMSVSCFIGISSLDSTGTAFIAAIIMTMIPLAWFALFAFANRGCW